jgi:hypothetical protein
MSGQLVKDWLIRKLAELLKKHTTKKELNKAIGLIRNL